MTRRVAILGGSFDPVHRGHLHICRRAREELQLDAVWLLPARWASHKLERRPTPVDHRLAMLRVAVANEDWLEVCEYELGQPEGQRSVDTVRALVRLHPDVAFHFLLGEDSFRALDDWKQPEELAGLARLVVMPRPPSSEDRPTSFAGHPVHWLGGEPVDLSSTQLRAELARGRGDSELPPGVGEYIVQHGLYSSGGEGA